MELTPQKNERTQSATSPERRSFVARFVWIERSSGECAVGVSRWCAS